MRPIRNPAKPPPRQRAPSAPWARPGPAGSCPSPANAHARPRSARAPPTAGAHLGPPRARVAPSPQVSSGPGGGRAASAAGRREKPPQPCGSAARTCAPGSRRGAGACARSQVGRDGAARAGLHREGGAAVQGSAGTRGESPHRPRALGPSCSVPAAWSWGSAWPLGGHLFSNPKAVTSHRQSSHRPRSPGPSTSRLRPARRPQVPPLRARCAPGAPPGDLAAASRACGSRASGRGQAPRPPARPRAARGTHR